MSSRLRPIFHKLFDTKVKKVTFTILSIGLILLILFGVSKTNFVQNLLKMAGIYLAEERVIEFETDGFETDEAGNVHITESVTWNSDRQAELTFDIESIIKSEHNNTDYLIVVDNSTDMTNIEYLKENLLRLSDEILQNENNKIALMTFNDNYQLITDFSNDKTQVNEKISGIALTGGCKYYVGLKGIEEILSTYTKLDGKDLRVLFITNSYTKSGNHKAEYQVLKEKYPYLVINAIQYNLGDKVNKDIKNISDNQFIANNETLRESLIDASLSPEYYEEFSLEYSVDSDFYIEDESNIKVPFGNVELTDEDGTQKVTWSSDNVYKTGTEAQLKIALMLDSKYNNTENYYATNKNLTINYKLLEEDRISVSSTNTPVLKNGYRVMYDANPPTGCSITSKDEEIHNIFSNVAISNEKPLCEGFEFAGWEIVTEDVQIINSDMFIMPEGTVELKGTWKKVSITKATEGIVVEKEQITAPVMTGGSDEWASDSVAMTLETAGTAESGVAYYEYYRTTDATDVPDINTQASGKTIKGTLTSSSNGVRYYYFRTVSTAGWKSEWSNVSVVKIDNTTPSCSISLSGGTIGSNNWYTSSPTVKMSTSVAGLSGISYGLSTSSSASYGLNVEDGNNGTTSLLAQTEGTTNYYGYVKTGSGKTATCSGTVNLETAEVTAPTMTGGSSSWKSANVTLSVSTAGTATSGVSHYEYVGTASSTFVPTAETSASGTLEGTSRTASTNGIRYYFFRTVSNAGRKSEWSAASTVKLDKIEPTCSISVTGGTTGSNGWYTSAPTITVTTSTAGESGLSYGLTTSTTATYGSTATSGNTGTKSVTASSGSKTYYGYVKSGSGKTASCSKTVKLETSVTAPTVTGGSTSWKSSNVALSVSTAGTATSGVANYEYYTTTSTTAPTASSTATGTTSGSVTISTNGTRYVYYRTVSNAGQKSSWTSANTVKLDKTTPTCTVSASGSTANGVYTSADVTVTTSTAGVSGLTYGLTTSTTATYGSTATSGNTGTKTVTASKGSKTYRGYVKTGAGKTASCSKAVYVGTKYTVTNLVPNPSFESSGGWSYMNATRSTSRKATGSYSLFVNDTNGSSSYWNAIVGETADTHSLTNNSVSYKDANFDIAAKSVIYMGAKVMYLSGTNASIGMTYNGDGIGASKTFQTATKNQFIYEGWVTTLGSRGNIFQFGSSVDSIGSFYIDDVVFVNLTEIFGAGNEPDTTWCNNNLGYFSGSKTVYK